eukprot:tig00000624_g2656.t1
MAARGARTGALALQLGLLLALAAAASAAEAPQCSELKATSGNTAQLTLATNATYTRSFLASSTQSMSVEFWVKLERFSSVVPVYSTEYNFLRAESSDFNDPNGRTYFLARAAKLAGGGAEISMETRGMPPASFTPTDLAAYEYWTHFAFVVSVDPNAFPGTTTAVIYVNGTAAGSAVPNANYPLPATDSIPALSWIFTSENTPNAVGPVARDIRVWGRALSAQDMTDHRYRRIRAVSDSYAAGFPDLKINIPLDDGTPGAEVQSPSVVNDVDCTALTATAGTTYIWTASAAGFCGLLTGGVPDAAAVAAGCTCGECPQDPPRAESPAGPEPKCYPPPPDTVLTTKYQVTCPPNVTISRVGPVNVTVGGAEKPLCGARMPDLRFLIAGNWSEPRVNITQEPRQGSFLPMHHAAAATSPEWAAHAAPTAPGGVRATITVHNPTDAGPEGECSFDIVVGAPGEGPPLCPGACPPPAVAVPVDPATCAATVPDLRRNLTLAAPDCIPPSPVLEADYVQEGEGESEGVEPGAVWQLAGPPPYAKELRLRHDGFPKGPSCPVRLVAYLERPSISWTPSLAGPADALSAAAVDALGADPAPADWARQLTAEVAGVCPWLLLQQCTARVRVEVNPALGVAGPDVDAAGNFTFGAGRRAWSLSTAGAALAGTFSREVPQAYLDAANIEPGTVLRTYVVTLTCAFNKGAPEPARLSLTSLAPVRVEIVKPGPAQTPAPAPAEPTAEPTQTPLP